MKKVENIVAKGEIACFEQFFLLSQCFQKLSAAEVSKSLYMWERVKNNLDLFSVLHQQHVARESMLQQSRTLVQYALPATTVHLKQSALLPALLVPLHRRVKHPVQLVPQGPLVQARAQQQLVLQVRTNPFLLIHPFQHAYTHLDPSVADVLNHCDKSSHALN